MLASNFTDLKPLYPPVTDVSSLSEALCTYEVLCKPVLYHEQGS